MGYEAARNVATTDQETFLVLTNAPWGDIGKRLTAYAAARARRYHWLSGSPEVLPCGMTPEQIAADVIAKTISGDRKFDSRRGELGPWLLAQVRSEVDNLRDSAENQKRAVLPDEDTVVDETRAYYAVVGADGEPETPETIFLAAEEAEERQNLLFAAASGASDLEDVVLTGLDIEEVKPRFLAEALEITARQVEVRLRRLGRNARKVTEA